MASRWPTTSRTSAATVKLTIDHELEGEGTKFIEAVSGGWPKIMSNLKSLLETGDVAFQMAG